MSDDKSSVDILFREHSFEEIESVRDNLASEIDKRTELLKSIVKEKYKDVVDTSDGIQSLKSNLAQVEQSIARLDKSITNFHQRIKEPKFMHGAGGGGGTNLLELSAGNYSHSSNKATTIDENQDDDTDLRQLLQMSAEIWDHFDSGNLKECVKLYNDAVNLMNKCQTRHASNPLFEDIKLNLNRSIVVIKNNLWYRVQSVEPNQIGVIASCDEEDLYKLSLQSSIEFLVEKLRKDISDNSYQAQIRRYQQYSYFNTDTNTIDLEVNDMKPPKSGYLQIPKDISLELSAFLFNVCRAINTIAGFSLTRSSILESLKMTMLKIIDVYTGLLALVNGLGGGSRTRRALQLYFDLKYVRVILNTSRDLSLIDELDSQISKLMASFEDMLDRVELYVMSDAMHTNALNLTHSTIRLYGLLIPYLQ
uniref:Conserved oligomeric Golgi complex subunit 1 n=1 Tax=Aceria tosichella TaxID=561515 RepID=A0A6G1SGV7_9ACAR